MPDTKECGGSSAGHSELDRLVRAPLLSALQEALGVGPLVGGTPFVAQAFPAPPDSKPFHLLSGSAMAPASHAFARVAGEGEHSALCVVTDRHSPTAWVCDVRTGEFGVSFNTGGPEAIAAGGGHAYFGARTKIEVWDVHTGELRGKLEHDARYWLRVRVRARVREAGA
jgi:hypothetical protein